jgi:hypothetical protein
LGTLQVFSSIDDATLAPTSAPTPAPTRAGFQTVEEEVERPAVVTAITFPLTLEEANNKVMQTAITEGTAASLGVAPDAVTITTVNGKAISSGSRYLQRGSGVDFEFKIVSSSADAGAVAKLTVDAKAAASEGAIVANIQKKASDAGVLVASLKAMPRAVVVTTSTVFVTIKATKQVAVDKSKPTDDDDDDDDDDAGTGGGTSGGGGGGGGGGAATDNATSGLTNGAIVGIAVGAVAFIAAVGFVLHTLTKKPSSPVVAPPALPPTPPAAAAPVGLGKTEDALGSGVY